MKKSRLALVILCIALLAVCLGAAACTEDDGDTYVRLAGKFVFLDEPTYDLSSGLILQSQTMELFTDYTLKTTIEYFNTLTSRFENTTMEGMYFYFEGENVITIAYNDLGSATYPFDGAKIDLPNWSLYLFEANSNGELQGNFHTITYNTTSGGSIRGATIQYVGHGGSTRPVSAIPDSGYEFAGWSDGVSSADRQETNITSSKTITAQFETSYILTYIAGAGGSIVGAGGSISSEISQQVMPGEMSAFPVTALPDYGYKFTGWSDGLTTAQRRDKNVISDLTVTANFAKAVNCDHVSLNEGEYCPECGMECYLRSDDDLLMKFDRSSNLYREIYGATATSVFNDYRYNIVNVKLSDNVTQIADSAFSSYSRISSIIIPNSVTSIGNSAFANCSNLTNITIPDSITSIGNNAFYWCRSLTSITIPDSVTSIGNSAFANCSNLTNITIPDSITSIGNNAFYWCRSLTSITIPDSVTSIESYAFSGCKALTIYCEATSQPSGWSSSWNSSNCPVVWNCNNNEADNDGNIYYIAESGIGYALNNGTATVIGQSTVLSGEIIIPEEITYKDVAYSVTTINASAFSGCRGLTSITIPDSVASIEYKAFSECSGLTSITISDGVTSIGNSAFSYCSSLTSITIPDSVTSIGGDAFSGCSGLTSITVEQGNAVYHSAGNCIIETASKTLIAGCKNSIIPNDSSVTSIGNYAFEGCSGLASITIPDSVTSIGGSAFSGCSGLTSITIPDSVTSIGNYAFRNCSGLESITVEQGNTIYHSAGNCIIETASKTLILGCQNSIIPNDGSITSIRWRAFEGCSGLTSITIPDSITSIGESAFEDCSGLTSITIPDSVTSIGDRAFSGCSGLTSITIPDSVTSIGNYAFWNCSGLESITVEQGNTIYHSAGNCIIETASKTLTAGCKNSVIPDDGSVISIGDYAFHGCSGLTSITIPDSVTSIGRYAFRGCRGLTSITIPDSVTSIGDYAFEGCSGLTIYCASESQPADWSEIWNLSGCTVVWGYKG